MKYILKIKNLLIIGLVINISILSCTASNSPSQNWTHFARIAGHGVNQNNVNDIIESAKETNVFGIEIDNSLTGYYSSFLNPDEKLKAIGMLADAAHADNNFAFVYTEGLETITTEADSKENTFFKDHPDWVQRNIDGDPAVFGSEHAFWISEGDEDVWISPFAEEWRSIYMERIRQIAETGIDGVYIDIPYWMTHFRGWDDTWASFDDYTVAAFKELTGINAKTDIVLGDYTDPNFIKWIDFRIDAITQFMKEVDDNVKSINPNCMTIAEIYPGLDEDAVRVGSDVYELYDVVDVIAHEYSEGGYTAANRAPFNWITYLAGMYTFRAFAGEKASWMLSYSWDEDENIDKVDAMENMILSHIMAGNNTWDSRGHVMSGSNDLDTRKRLFEWIKENENIFYKPRKTIDPIGIYFSPKSRNYFPETFIKSFFGYMHLALTSHREFEIVMPRTLDDFSGKLLILPNILSVNDKEINQMNKLSKNGTKFIITGESGKYDDSRNVRDKNELLSHFMTEEAEESTIYDPNKKYIYYESCPGLDYFQKSNYEYNTNSRVGWYNGTNFYTRNQRWEYDVDYLIDNSSVPKLEAPPYLATQLASVNNKPHFFLTNFIGLEAGKNAKQKSAKLVKMVLPDKTKNVKVFYLPFLGDRTELPITEKDGVVFVDIPPITKGAVVWYE
ncbi:hypothetical protein ACFL0J_05430 [Candidatus Neomarinimicrobiota bacterium]